MKHGNRTYRPAAFGAKAAFAGLLIVFMSAAAFGQIDIVTPKDSTVSSLDRQVVTVRSVPGSLVDLLVNCELVRTDTIRIDGLLDFINVQVPSGNVLITAQMHGRDGVPGIAIHRMMHILGTPASVDLSLGAEKMFADGKSSTSGNVAVYDRWNYRIPEDVIVTVDADSGMLKGDDVDHEKKGLQLRIHNGDARFEYVAGSFSGVALIKATLDTVQVSRRVDLNTPFEKFTLVGYAGGTAQSAKASTGTAELGTSRDYPDGLVTDGRAAVYARGTVFGDYRLTASFDNDRRNTSRFYRDLDPDYLYSIYGDNSMLTYDAQTTRQLYARIEHDRSFALVGDFNTDLSKQEFTAYNRTLYGVKAGHQTDGWRFNAFGSRTDRKVVQVEIRGNGLSGLYDLGYLNVTQGSEKVRIETRDRFHSEVVLKQVDQYRFSDYEIDYAQGTLFFKQPVPAIDAQGNPVTIVVSFEAADAQKMSYVAGGRVEHDITGALSVGANSVVEEQDPVNYTLLGGDAKYRLNERSTISGEVGRSSTFSGSGLAYKVESTISPLSSLSLTGYYRRLEKEFTNPTQSGSGREVGTRKYGAGGSWQADAGTKFSAEFYNSLQETSIGDVRIRSISGSVEEAITTQMNGTLRMEDVKYDGAGTDTSGAPVSTHSLIAAAGINYHVSQRFTLGIEHNRNLGSDRDVTRPNGTIISGEYRIADPVTIQAAEKFYEDGSSLSSVGLSTTPLEGTSLYSRYEIGNAIGQHRNLLSIGLKNRLRLPFDLTGNFGIERTKSLETRLGETPTDDHVAYSGSLEYLPESPVKASVKAEYGEDNTARKINYFAGFDYRLMRDVSAIVKWNMSTDNSRKNDGYENRSHLIFGAAYRPVEHDWLNVVGKFELKTDNNHYLAPFTEDDASIASVHFFVEPVQRVEIGSKVAYKVGTEKTVGLDFTSHTYFLLFNGRYHLSQRLDVGGEYRLLRQKEAQDWLIGYSAEAGYVLINNLRMAAGYNFKGYKEQDLVDYSLWTKGPYVRMSFKFDEGLLGL